MAGSNGSPRGSGQVPPNYPAETEEQARARQYERWLELQQRQTPGNGGFDGQQGYAQPAPQGYGHAYDQQGQAADQAGGYGYDAHGQQPTDHGHSYGGGYEAPHQPFPQFEQYQPGSDPNSGHFPPQNHQDAYQSGHPQQGGYQQGYDAGGYAPPDPGLPGDPFAQPFEQPGLSETHHHYRGEAQNQFSPQGANPHDVGAYDLSHYQPGQMPPGFGADGAHNAAQGWSATNQDPYAGQQNWRAPQQGEYWPQGDAPEGGQFGYETGASGYPAQQHYGEDQHEHDDYEAGEDEPRKGPGTLVIVGALVGAIIAGGGMAYAYKIFSGSGSHGKPQIVRGNSAPVKTQPTDSGGMEIAHADKAVLNQTSSEPDRPVPTSLRPPSDSGGPKRVATTSIIVNPDGTIRPTMQNAPQAPVGGSGVPGLVLDGFGPPPGAPPPQPQAHSSAAHIAPPPPPPAVRPSLPPPAPPPPQVSNQSPSQAQEEVPVPKRSPQRPLRTAAIASAPRTAHRSAGYVAVLASKRNCRDARNAFAPLFQKYPDVLAGKTPDVKQVNLPDKGTWCRLIVGPPGSRQAARDICVALKGRGMTDCWPVSY
ncbi:MAG: SPOR domain-containing protein [Hyphomicrobiaceae bacterium]